MLGWKRITMEMKMTPRSAYIMHDTLECFDDSKGGFFWRRGVSMHIAGANVRRRQAGV